MARPPSSAVKGFLPDDEGEHLYRAALRVAAQGAILEIGSYCGRSTIWLAQAAAETASVVFAVDHHRGSEEHQPGEIFHDSDLTDANGQFDSFPAFRTNLTAHNVAAHVIPIVASSQLLGRHWGSTQLAMVFIDGGHSLDAAVADYRTWAPQVLPGGLLAIHDVFPNPADGGQAPFTIWRLAVDSGLFDEHSQCGSLRILRRIPLA